MDDFLQRLATSETTLRSAMGRTEPGHICGTCGVLISVPHAVPHTREGREKKAEINTFAIAYEVHEATGCHVMYNTDPTCDPNYDAGGTYKERLRSLIEEESISFVIDLHGASMDHGFDLELGTNNGANLLHNSLPADILRLLADAAGFKTDIDQHFKAGNPNTIAAYTANVAGIPAVQIEVNRHNRDTANPSRLQSTVKFLTHAVRLLCASGFEWDSYLAYTATASSITLPHNRLELPAEAAAYLSLHEITGVVSVDGKEDCYVKDFTADAGIKVGKRVFDRLFSECPVALVRKSCYQRAKVYKPRVEAIDNSCVSMSAELYEQMKDYHTVEVFNPLSGIRACLTPRLYTHNINGRKQAVWLSFMQRRLLNMELPHVVSPALDAQLREKLTADDYAYFAAHFHRSASTGDMHINRLNEQEHRRMKQIFMPLADTVSIRGIDTDSSQPKHQSALLERYIGNTTIYLHTVRCSENDEILDGIMLSKTNIKRLGLSDGDKVYVRHLGRAAYLRIHELDKDTYGQVMRLNNLDSIEDVEMVVCIPARYRFALGIRDINVCVSLQRDLVYLVRKNITEQMMALIGTVIAIASMPGITTLSGCVAFLLLAPLVLYSILSKEREKI